MTPPEAQLRAFVALELDDDMHARLESLIAELRPAVPGVRWVRPEGIHLTLRFLGSATPAQIETLRGSLGAVAARCPAGEAAVRGLGVFPERGQPRVLWVGLEVPPEVLRMQSECERAARAAGFPPETRPFTPHLTLGRWRDKAPRPALRDVDLGRTPLRTLTLFRSELRPGGAVYTPLGALPLGGGA